MLLKTRKLKPLNFISTFESINIEHYNEMWFTNKNYYMHDLYYSTFYKKWGNQILKGQNNIVDDIHDDWFILNQYDFLNVNSFYLFFQQHNIDIPKCFQNSLSLVRPVRDIPLISFINYFMRHGKRLKMQNYIIESLNTFMHIYLTLLIKPQFNLWKSLFLILNNKSINTSTSQYLSLYLNNNMDLKFNHYNTLSYKNISSKVSIYNILFKNLLTFLPVFSFYIYKVDKKIFKNTRGKSGKFTFIWKYIAPYKRLNWVMYWLSKELKLKNSKTIHGRLTMLFNDILFSPHQTWIFKIKKFSYNYVYRNARFSLAETYKTTTK